MGCAASLALCMLNSRCRAVEFTGTAGALHRGKGTNMPQGASCLFPTCSGYIAEPQSCLYQCKLGFHPLSPLPFSLGSPCIIWSSFLLYIYLLVYFANKVHYRIIYLTAQSNLNPHVLMQQCQHGSSYILCWNFCCCRK